MYIFTLTLVHAFLACRYLHSISGAPLPNTPDHRIILQHGLADAQVNWMGVRYASYSVGAAVFSSNVKQGNESLAHFTNVPDASVLTTGVWVCTCVLHE